MIYSILDITLNIVAPLFCLLGSGFYVYKSGRWFLGILITWTLLFSIEIVSLLMGGLVAHYSLEYSSLFEEGPGTFVMLVLGWIPGVLVSLISMLARTIISRIMQRRESTERATNLDLH